MTKAHHLVNNCNSGELSPRIDARVDIEKYLSGCRTLENFIPLVEGGVVRMPGTYYVGSVKNSSKETRLIPFAFSTTQQYVLEFGEQYIRFYMNDGQIVITDGNATNYSASSAQTVHNYVKAGSSVDISWAGSKHVYVMAPFGRPNSDTVKVEATTNGADALSVTEAGDTITIAVANGTSSKNTGALIQAAIRALGTCNGVDVSDWVVCENFAYAAARPITATLAATLLSGGETIFQCLKPSYASANCTNHFPPAESLFWEPITNGAAVEVPTPYLEAHLFELKIFQSADILYICHPSYPMKQLSRTGHTQWSLENFRAGTGDVMDITGITAADPPVVTCVTVPATLAAGDIVYLHGVSGMYEVDCEFFTVGTVVTGAGGTFELSGIVGAAYNAWASGGTAQECVYGTDDNQPSCGTFFEQRIILAGSNNDPQKFNGSASADFNDFTLGADDDDGIEFTIASQKVDRILWVVNHEYLIFGTVGGLYRAGASSISEPLTATNISVVKFIENKIKNVAPEVLADSIVWVTMDGTTLRRLGYSQNEDKNVAVDMTAIAKHIAFGDTRALSGLKQLAFQSVPLPMCWSIRKDGTLLGMTYENQENVFAWFRIITDGEFESIAVIGDEDEEEQIWVVVKRTINGSTVRYIEYFKEIEFFSELEDCFFVHSGLSWEGTAAATVVSIELDTTCAVVVSASHGITAGDKLRFIGTGTWLDNHVVTAHSVSTNTIQVYNEGDTAAIDSTAFTAYTSGGTVETVLRTVTGLSHLEGETVSILGDGAVIPSEVVSSGSITMDYWCNHIHIGLPYTSTLEPMKLHVGLRSGTNFGRLQRVNRMVLNFYRTVGGKAGPNGDNLYSLPFGTGDPPELFTGSKVFEFPGDWERESTITVVQDQPLPMSILSLMSEVEIGDR